MNRDTYYLGTLVLIIVTIVVIIYFLVPKTSHTGESEVNLVDSIYLHKLDSLENKLDSLQMVIIDQKTEGLNRTMDINRLGSLVDYITKNDLSEKELGEIREHFNLDNYGEEEKQEEHQ